MNIFTKLRNKLNDREDKLLLEVDKKYDELFFPEELIKKSEKLPNKINSSIKMQNQKKTNGKIDQNCLF